MITKEKLKIPKFYCINLKFRTDRKKRIISRFSYHKLDQQLQFVEAIDKKSPLIAKYGSKIFHTHYPLDQQKGEVACFLSHLKAIKLFLETGEKEAIICEDDIMLKNDWINEYSKVRINLPNDANLLSLGYYVKHWMGFQWAGKNPSLENICHMVKEHVWMTTSYWISRKYAEEVIKKWDKPFHLFGGFRTSELITRMSKGYISYPPLGIEDCISSNIRNNKELKLHLTVTNVWGYQNYSDAEKVHISPLYKDECQKLNKPYDPERKNESQKMNSLKMLIDKQYLEKFSQS